MPSKLTNVVCIYNTRMHPFSVMVRVKVRPAASSEAVSEKKNRGVDNAPTELSNRSYASCLSCPCCFFEPSSFISRAYSFLRTCVYVLDSFSQGY